MDNINDCQLNQACDFRFNSNMKSQLIYLQAFEIDIGTDHGLPILYGPYSMKYTAISHRTKMFDDRSKIYLVFI